MIRHDHKFIFIHIPKTGGTSIEGIFKEDVGGPFEGSRGVKRKHASARKMKKIHPAEWDEYFKFAVVRNPFDLLVSRYHWSRDVQCLSSFNEKKTFRQFIIAIDRGGFKPKWAVPKSQLSFLSVNKEMKMDFIVRFENLQEDFNIVCDKIGIPRKELPHINKSNHKHYTEYYDDETREIVAKRYAKDIEYFGYEFGG